MSVIVGKVEFQVSPMDLKICIDVFGTMAHPPLHTLPAWSALQRTILSAHLPFVRTNVSTHCWNRYFLTDCCSHDWRGWMVSPLTPQPSSPKLTPLSEGPQRKWARLGLINQCGAMTRAQLVLCLPRPLWPLLPTSRCRPSLTKPGPDQMELISN